MKNKSYRTAAGKKNANESKSLAACFNIDSTIIHKIWTISQIFAFVGTLTYIVCAFKLPKRHDNNVVDSE